MIDSHCHLNYKGLIEQQADVIERAHAAGVSGMLNISTREREWADIIVTAERHSGIWASIGIHPHEADEHPDVDARRLIAAAAHPKVIGIGETGLDYYYEHSPRAPQITNFRAHIAAARQSGLPVIVHTRDADDDTIAVLEEEMAKGAFTGLIHCFTGTQRLADASLALGLMISVSGIATFKNSQALRDVIKSVPLDRLLVETDAPFLAPVPHRGKTNEPAFVVHTAKMLAELKGVSEAELAAATTENFFRLFRKVKRPG